MRRPCRVDGGADLEQAGAFLILFRVEDHVSVRAVVACAGIGGLHSGGAAEELRAGGEIESVQAMEIISVGVFGHGHDIDRAMRAARAVDDRRGRHADLR